jgi:hypothetical protein
MDLAPRTALAAYGRDRALVAWGAAAGVEPGAPDWTVDVPELRLPPSDAGDLGVEIFQWELATAVAGSLLGLHPFDQPDVDAAKVAARRLVVAAHDGSIEPRGDRLHASPDWRWYGSSPALRSAGARGVESPGQEPGEIAPGQQPGELLRAHLGSLARGDFFALLAYLPRGGAIEAELRRARLAVAARRRVATTLGFGPRYLHSTGQYFKGGPNRGVYLFVTRQVEDDLAIPGQELGFGALQRAQALGDIEVLIERGRRVLHVDLARDVERGVARLQALFESVSG